ncbi:hypothetical protein M9458_016793, partial [Cirrhinus mrigala]
SLFTTWLLVWSLAKPRPSCQNLVRSRLTSKSLVTSQQTPKSLVTSQLTPPEPRHVLADIPSHAEPTLPSHKSTASTPSRPAGIPLSTVLPVMAVAILSVWATHCCPEASSDHESAPEPSSDHGSVPEAFLANEFAPIPPEVSACTVELPKEVASMNELTATSDHEFAPVPPEVSAKAVEPPTEAASSYELSAHH